MLKAFSTPRNRTLTFVFLAVCVISGVVAAVIGISDNPPGIFSAFLAVISFILAFVHPWRTAKQYRRLLYAALIGFVIFAVLHNIFEALAGKTAGAGVLQIMLQGIGVAAFLLAILICPPAVVVGAVGAIVMFLRNRRHSTPGRNKAA